MFKTIYPVDITIHCSGAPISRLPMPPNLVSSGRMMTDADELHAMET